MPKTQAASRILGILGDPNIGRKFTRKGSGFTSVPLFYRYCDTSSLEEFLITINYCPFP